MDLVEGIMGNQPDSGQLTFYAPYSLGEFRLFYRKICSQLAPNQSKLLYELCKSSESDLVSHSNLIGSLGKYWHPDLPRPFEENAVKEAKKSYLQGFLCGASLDYLEVISDEFRLVPMVKEEVEDGNFMCFICSCGRGLREIIKLAEQLGHEKTHYGSFVTHQVDGKDYVLVGKRLLDYEHRRRLCEWELDKDWD